MRVSARPETLTFTQHLACPVGFECYEELAPRNFSFNSPYGACEHCDGLGTTFEVDPELVVPDPDVSVNEGAISPWSTARTQYFQRMLDAVAQANGIDLDKPWGKLTKAQQNILLYGVKGNVTVKYKNRYGRQRQFSTAYEGVIPFLQRRHQTSESDWSREQIETYMREVPCPHCGGARLKPATLAVTIGGKNISEVCDLSIGESSKFLASLELSERDRLIAERVVKEVNARMSFLLDVGLDYLTLARSAGTLAGGEAQRIRLASQIGSGLVGVLYVLDEPSIGLHQRDNRRLIDTLVRLRDLGNTVLVVEHDEETIKIADWVVDIGPGAGEHGRRRRVLGPGQGPAEVEGVDHRPVRGRQAVDPEPRSRRTPGMEWLTIRGAREHNLKNIDVAPAARVLRGRHGRVGLGQVHPDRRHPVAVADAEDLQEPYRARAPQDGGGHRAARQGHRHRPVAHRPHAPLQPGHLHRRVRPHPAAVRHHAGGQGAGLPPGPLLASTSAGGRCEACAGDGTIKIEMHFLPDVYVPCEVCKGARYNRDTLDVTFKGKNISEVLDMPMRGGLRVLRQPARHRPPHADPGRRRPRLRAARPARPHAVGRRGPAGEAVVGAGQALHRPHHLPARRAHHRPALRGRPQAPHRALSRLVDQGNTVLVIEHNLDVIKTADWVIDLGPEGGSGGGTVVAEGSPEDIVGVPASHTGRYLAPLLNGSPR